MSELTNKLIEEFKDKETRHIYAEDFLNTYIATQLKVLREERDWTQAKVAAAADMAQERISVLEDVNYDSWSVRTLKRLAKAFDLRLSIKFETFGSFLQEFEGFERSALSRVSFDDDPAFKPSTKLAMETPAVAALTAAMSHLKAVPSQSLASAAFQQSLTWSSPQRLPQTREVATANHSTASNTTSDWVRKDKHGNEETNRPSSRRTQRIKRTA